MEIIEKALNLPWYIYLIIFLGIVFIFGKSRDWVYEAKLYQDGGEDTKADMEIKKYKNEAPKGEILLLMSDFNVDGDIEVKLNDDLICHMRVSEKGRYVETIYPPAVENKKKKYRPQASIRMKRLSFNLPESFRPQNKDEVKVILEGQVISGQLFKS